MVSPGVRLGAIDLNLLVVFDAVMRERGVTRAGHLLGLSQPAMSHALARLRHMLKDELFVRGPKGMVPTPRAEELAAPIRQALDGLRQSLEPARFDPAQARRTVRIAVDNYAALVLTAALARRISDTAPGLTADFVPSGTVDIADRLDNGGLDLVIGVHPVLGERFSWIAMLEDDFVAVLRTDHPAASAATLAAEAFAAMAHLEISSVRVATDFIDQALARRDLSRRVALRAPLVAAARVLATSDMACVFPRRMAEALVHGRPLTIRPLAFAASTLELAMIWPRRLDNQATHRWLREMVGGVCENLSAQSG